jgi:hypothetical protein
MNDEMSDEPKAMSHQGWDLASALGKWVAIASAAVTIFLTVGNYFTSQRITAVEQDLKQKQELLEESKDRLARYAFVQSLFGGVLNPDPAQKTLTVNLITLTLNEDEAKRFFAGLESSHSAATREIGTLGTDLTLSNLVRQMNDPNKQTRMQAVQKLIDEYNGNQQAIDQALLMLEPPLLDRLSSSGRINVLVFLRNTDATAWTTATLKRAQDAVARAGTGTDVGSQTQDALNQLSNHLKDIHPH